MSGSSRRCGTCRWFKDAGMGGTGWCTHPDRQTSSDVRILVRKAELACRNSWGQDLWAAIDGAEEDVPVEPIPTTGEVDDAAFQITFEDEVTSVVDADIHRSQTGEDLNDRVVDQSSLAPEDDDDDRFDLLARGGRDSVSKARSRMLRRRQGRQNDAGDIPPVADAPRRSEPVTFEPDDFVEEEGPAANPPAPHQASPYDDVVLSENTQVGSPRSRRLRREREGSTRPKTDAVVETTPDVPTPAKPQGITAMSVGDPFNTVPEIAKGIDISRLRKGSPVDSQTVDPAPIPTPEPEPAEDQFERAILSAQAIRAAARAERQGRHLHARRQNILPRVDGRPDAPSREAFALPARDPEQNPPPSPPYAEPSVSAAQGRTRISTRPELAPSRSDHDDAATTDDPRTSWWRGMFQPRTSSIPHDDTWTNAGPEMHDDDWEDSRAPLEDIDVNASPVDDLDEAVASRYAPVDLQAESGMDAFRRRLFSRPRVVGEPREHRTQAQSSVIAPNDLLQTPEDAWFEPEPEPGFDVRRLIEHIPTLLDMTIEISPEVPRECATCRSYRQSDQGARGWCTNNWAFTHRQMVNATDLACASTIGCWWLPADEEVWLDDSEPERVRTPRIDRLIAHLDPLREASGS